MGYRDGGGGVCGRFPAEWVGGLDSDGVGVGEWGVGVCCFWAADGGVVG